MDESWFGGLRTAMRSFTARGRAFVAAGLTSAACGVVLGERDLVRIGALVLLIPLVTAVAAARSGQRLSLVRRAASPVIEVGQATTVLLDIGNVGRRTGLLLLEEQVPWALGHRPRFLIGWLAPGRSRHVRYSVQADVRGLYEVGPLQVRVADPFGMLSTYRTFPRRLPVVVVPAAEPLPGSGFTGARSGTGEHRPQPFTAGHAADSTVRDYRQGDDLRRVHWPSTARTGELMVRQEEHPWQSHSTVLVDNRGTAHRGSGPDSSLERAVTVAASVAAHLSRAGYRVRLVDADGNEHVHAAAAPRADDGGDPIRPMLEFLAGMKTTTSTRITPARHTEGGAGGLFVAVLGELDDQARSTLLRTHAPGTTSYAISLDVRTWTPRDGDLGTTSSTSFLRARGWRAVDLARGGSLAAAWTELSR
ncbi:MAG: DUF58 domain-containing protein [Propionibacteriales bacterium]|nr:DUF58 domain-containing protein [Propionibacteriales bacterium]